MIFNPVVNLITDISEEFDSGLFKFSDFATPGERTWLQSNPTTALGLHRALIVPSDRRQWLEAHTLCPTNGVCCVMRGGVAYLPIRVAIALNLPEFEQWVCAVIPPEVV